VVSWVRSVLRIEDSSNSVFIRVQSETQVDLVWTSSCCIRSRYPVMIVLELPGLIGLPMLLSRCKTREMALFILEEGTISRPRRL